MQLVRVTVAFTLTLILATAGCASYATPGPGANMTMLGVTPTVRKSLTDPDIRSAMEAKPLAALPTGVAVARVQGAGYKSYTNEGWGNGNYTVVTTRDVETDADFARLEKLPLISGIAPINRLLLTNDLQSDLQLRQAAARLRADMLLIYTLDTKFTTEDKLLALSVVTLGLSPNRQVRLTTTASAVLMDTRTGYVYGLAEATQQENKMTSGWDTDKSIDETRRSTEEKAFTKLVGELETTWNGVIKQFASAQPVKAQVQ